MANKHRAAKPQGELTRNFEETLQIERYWHLADRPESRIPPKDYHYVKELAHLQFELIKLQEWVRLHGLRICVLFEGARRRG
jgi:polyphosphate kinase 2 (PPK2 family)